MTVAGKNNKEQKVKIKLPYWGIDGCKSGWFCAGLGTRGEYDYLVSCDIQDAHRQIKERGGKIALIDIPIGLRNDAEERVCDKKAREFIGKSRKSSVFRTPCRQAIEAYRTGKTKAAKEKKGKLASVRKTGGCLSQQTWAITGKIVEVDAFVQSDKRNILREVHPEVCFCALNGKKHLSARKTIEQGKLERLTICSRYFAGASQLLDKARLCKGVKPDDVLDALAAAITAKLGRKNGYKKLPKNPPKDGHLPMEMMYVVAAPTR